MRCAPLKDYLMLSLFEVLGFLQANPYTVHRDRPRMEQHTASPIKLTMPKPPIKFPIPQPSHPHQHPPSAHIFLQSLRTISGKTCISIIVQPFFCVNSRVADLISTLQKNYCNGWNSAQDTWWKKSERKTQKDII